MDTLLLIFYQSKFGLLKYFTFLLEFTFEFILRLLKSINLFSLILQFNFIFNLDLLKFLHHLNLLFLIAPKIHRQLALRLQFFTKSANLNFPMGSNNISLL